MLIPKTLSRPKIIALLIVLLVVLGGTGYLLMTRVFPSSSSSTSQLSLLPAARFDPDIEAALQLPDPAAVFNPNWFHDPLLQQLQNDASIIPIAVPSMIGQSDPFSPLASRGSGGVVR